MEVLKLKVAQPLETTPQKRHSQASPEILD
jgi:hypothetical protein